MIQIVPLADVPPQPWRNGGGATQELLAWPVATDWLVRISVARIVRDGPFSSFPGVDRWFAVVHGAGVTLHFPAGDVALHAGTPPTYFDGVVAPGCTLVDGATQDLNLMLRHAAGQGTMARVDSATPWVMAATLRALYAATPVILAIDECQPISIPAGTLAWCTETGAAAWRVTAAPGAPPPHAWWLGFSRVTSPA